MNRDDLFKSIGEIDDQTVICTEAYRKQKRNRVIVRLIAASLALVLLVFGIPHLFSADNSEQAPASWFIITAQAAEGDWNELSLNDGFFNSVASSGQSASLFPVDVPLFRFVIDPSSWDNYESKYWQFEISVSYNGKTVDSLDDQIVVFYCFPVSGSDAPYTYEVVGWFEETTDVNITVVDRSTGDLVEKITVNVKPLPADGGYELTVTDIQTNNE